MKQRTPGRSGLSVSALGLGFVGMSLSFGDIPDPVTMIPVLCCAVDQGVTFPGRIKLAAAAGFACDPLLEPGTIKG